MRRVRQIPDVEYAGFLISPPDYPVRHVMGQVLVADHYGEKAKELGISMPDGYTAFRVSEDARYVVVMKQPTTVTELPSTVGTGYVDLQRRKVCIQSIYEG